MWKKYKDIFVTYDADKYYRIYYKLVECNIKFKVKIVDRNAPRMLAFWSARTHTGTFGQDISKTSAYHILVLDEHAEKADYIIHSLH